MSIRECDRCHALKPDGQRCKQRTCQTQFCWIHSKTQLGLRIKPSTIGGKGLFAAKPFKKNASVARYTGEALTKAQLEQRYGNATAPYGLQLAKNRYLDARSTLTAAGRYVNDCRGTGQRCNAKLTKAATVKATANIPFGREILAPYGAKYWS